MPGRAGAPFRAGGRAGLWEGAEGQPPSREACASPVCLHLGKGVLVKSYQELVVAEVF